VVPRNKFYCQCLLVRSAEEGRIENMVSWIPSDIAKEGNLVRLKESGKDLEWSEGWTVAEVRGKIKGELAEAFSDLWKHQRKMSDI